MIRSIHRGALLVAVLLFTEWTCRGAAPDPAENRPESSDPGAGAARPALQAEVDGDDSTRNRLLERALQDGADDPMVRWYLGYVRSGERWVPYAQELESTEERKVAQQAYRQARAAAADTVAGQLGLANVAREHSLADEERAHLRRVVALDWNHEEARRRLGDVRVEGFWVTEDEVREFAQRLETTRAQRAAWDPCVQPIVRRLLRSQQTAWEKTWQELAAIRDPAAIPSVEAALAAGDRRSAVWYLDWLEGVDAWEASVALSRQAVLAPSADIRTRAQQRLTTRPIDDYALVLVGSLRADPVARTYLGFTPFGGLLYVEQVAFETQFDRRETNLAVIYGPEAMPGGRAFVRTLQFDPAGIRLALEHLRRHYAARNNVESADIAARVDIMNSRILRTMAGQVPEARLDSPEKCWEWFNQHHGLAFAGEKPLLRTDYEETWSVDRNRRRVQQTPRRIVTPTSCFAAGTQVVTAGGLRPIDEVQVGDRVLSQDIETGELAYRSVLQTTKSNPVPLATLVTSHGELTCTAGHPFWVNTHGWKLARDVAAGGRFHGVDGAVEIVSIEDTNRVEPAYNLIVADFHTYFAGDGRILSHDNTPRAPTNALVPGLMPDYASADPVP